MSPPTLVPGTHTIAVDDGIRDRVRDGREQPSRAAGLRDRLVPPIPGSAIWGWAGPLLVTVFGAFLRFNRLSVPHAVVFDETYYVGDAYGILRHGVEINHVKNANALLAARQDPHPEPPAASSPCTRRWARSSSPPGSGCSA